MSNGKRTVIPSIKCDESEKARFEVAAERDRLPLATWLRNLGHKRCDELDSGIRSAPTLDDAARRLADAAAVLDDAARMVVEMGCTCAQLTRTGGHRRDCQGVKRARQFEQAASAARRASNIAKRRAA